MTVDAVAAAAPRASRVPPPAPGTPAAPAPDRHALDGWWQRSLLRLPDGSTDTGSEVSWLQAGSIFVDLRLPESRPDLGHLTCLRDADRDDLLALAATAGFAGSTTYEGGVMTWRHLLDLQAPSGAPDRGRLHVQDGVLVETGLQVPYVEHWHRRPGPQAPVASLVLRRPMTGESAILVRCGDTLGWARSRALPLRAAEALTHRVQGAVSVRAAQDLLDTEISLAEITPAGAVIRRSSLPFREGARLDVAGRSGRVVVADLAADGTPVDREWSIVEARGSIRALLTADHDSDAGAVLR